MASPWIEHVKQWAKAHNMKYNEAIKNSACKAAYGGGKMQGILSKANNPLKGRVSKALYRKGDSAKDALEQFKAAKSKRNSFGMSPFATFGVSPSGVAC